MRIKPIYVAFNSRPLKWTVMEDLLCFALANISLAFHFPKFIELLPLAFQRNMTLTISFYRINNFSFLFQGQLLSGKIFFLILNS